MVPARITAVTLGARDLPALRDFYVRLGWPLIVDMDDFCAFGTRGCVFTLYLLEKLAADSQVPAGALDAGMRSNLAINVDRPEEVDEAIEAVRAAGGRITHEPVQMEWGGRSAYFADPEENYWEVAWVPEDTTMAQAIRDATAAKG